jgi:hypothetical protein
MTGFLIFIVVAVIISITGLYNLGSKARKLEQTDEEFFQSQLILAKQECFEISKQFARQLALERSKYVRKDSDGNLLDDEWMNKGVESFFQTTVCPKLVDVQRECLIQFSAYPEIIDKVASSAQQELSD